ncbi:hypothetical protein B9Z19DRAFT_1061043 [Tuber borchii]|uniref:Uncharacterized protein n=1 Tax=Tuber borchii TaxID=42251 RepID=A0A2T7A6P2_TUBBO|nr:hypothetical protein B9Z19DRAFT_1061043 [Tuber borchii]
MQATLRTLYPDSNTAEFHKICEDFISDNDNLEGLAPDSSESGIPDASQLVEEQVQLGLLTRGVHDMEVSYLDAPGDSDENQEIDFVPPALFTHSEAIEHLYHLSRYLQSLPINTLPTPAGRKITLSTMPASFTILPSALYNLLIPRVISYQESLKKQTKIDHYFTRLSSHSTTQKEDWKRKGKDFFLSDQGGDVERTAGSETADEEEETSFKTFQPGPRLYPHPEDSQDLNLYPSQYDHGHGSGFSQVYGNLLL